MGAMTQWLSDADEFVRGIGAGALLVKAATGATPTAWR
jgi:hypothetical protein